MSITIQVDGTDQHEMNVSNRNFCVLWKVLGLNPTPVGQVDSRLVLARLSSVSVQAITMEGQLQVTAQGVHYADMGISLDQAIRYFKGLDRMCTLATKREDPIIWY